MRILISAVMASALLGQTQTSTSNFQSGWPCTGKRSFDPAYGKLAEATGGHLFLFDPSEAAGFSLMAIGDLQHPQTLHRTLGRSESFQDLKVLVDSSVESLFVVAWMECTQAIQIYGPDGRLEQGDPDHDKIFRAGRITTIAKPTPGQWTLRLAGMGAYSAAIQARTSIQMKRIHLTEQADGPAGQKAISLWLDESISDPSLQIMQPDGAAIQEVALLPDPGVARHFTATFTPQFPSFRIVVRAEDDFQRTDPRLFESSASH